MKEFEYKISLIAQVNFFVLSKDLSNSHSKIASNFEEQTVTDLHAVLWDHWLENVISQFAYLHVHTHVSTSKHCCRYGRSECKYKPTGCESHSLLCKWRFHYPCIPLYRVSPYMQGKFGCMKSSPCFDNFYPGRCYFTTISCYIRELLCIWLLYTLEVVQCHVIEVHIQILNCEVNAMFVVNGWFMLRMSHMNARQQATFLF